MIAVRALPDGERGGTGGLLRQRQAREHRHGVPGGIGASPALRQAARRHAPHRACRRKAKAASLSPARAWGSRDSRPRPARGAAAGTRPSSSRMKSMAAPASAGPPPTRPSSSLGSASTPTNQVPPQRSQWACAGSRADRFGRRPRGAAQRSRASSAGNVRKPRCRNSPSTRHACSLQQLSAVGGHGGARRRLPRRRAQLQIGANGRN